MTLTITYDLLASTSTPPPTDKGARSVLAIFYPVITNISEIALPIEEIKQAIKYIAWL